MVCGHQVLVVFKVGEDNNGVPNDVQTLAFGSVTLAFGRT